MAVYGVVDVATNIVVNVIEADETFDPGEPDYIKVQDDNVQIGWLYDPINGTVSAPPVAPIDELYLLRDTQANEGVTVNSIVYLVDDIPYLMADYMQVVASLSATGNRTIERYDSSTVNLSPADLMSIYDQLLQLRSSLLYAFSTVKAAIDLDTITLAEEVDIAYPIAFSEAPSLSIVRLNTEVETLTTAVDDLDTRVTTLETPPE